MKEKIEKAIEILTEIIITKNVKSDDALRYTQAILNLMHALATQDTIKNK